MDPASELARRLTRASVARPRLTAALGLGLTLLLLHQATRLGGEVGYAAYFGPGDPAVERLAAFFEEFESGLHVLVVFGCPGSRVCASLRDRAGLEFLGRLQARIDHLPNVRGTRSLLTSPLVVGPFETRSLADPDGTGGYALAADWERLLEPALGAPFLAELVVAHDARTAGIVVELQSLESAALRESVHALLALARAHEAELGAEIYVAGDPVWAVVADDDLDADARNLTLLMLVLLLALLFAFYGDPWLALLPVLSVGGLAVAIHGVAALAGVPMTAILAALPPLLLVIAIAASIHLLTAFARRAGDDPRAALAAAASEVGAGCFWSAATTAAGFASFLWSDLTAFRQFGAIAAMGVGLGWLGTFTLLPALLCLRPPRGGVARLGLAREVVGAAQAAVFGRPGFVLVTGAAVTAALAAGIPHLAYEVDFGDQSLVLRSVRFMEANFRRPMTTELVVTLPQGRRIHDAESLRLLDRLERWFDAEPSTGGATSFLDFLGEAYRVRHGAPAPSLAALVAAAPAEMAIAAGLPGVATVWSESALAGGGVRDRARISVHRSWLAGDEQIPYVERLHAFLDALNRELAADGTRVELAGGLELAALAERRIRDTQWSSFTLAFEVVLLTLLALLAREPRLAALGVAANALPVVALLGLMGWTGIAVDPANAMVAAILLTIAVDDTIHVSLRYAQERRIGAGAREAIAASFAAVGEAVVVTSVCLALGFAVLMFSRWGGLVSFGLLASLGILLALAGDLLLLPAALVCREPRRA
jgi:predicted RND superfamily exporter protein